MKTLTVDANKRVRIPDAKPKQVFAYGSNSDGTVILTPVKAAGKGTLRPSGVCALFRLDTIAISLLWSSEMVARQAVTPSAPTLPFITRCTEESKASTGAGGKDGLPAQH